MPAALIDIEHAREIVLSEVRETGRETVALRSVLGRTLAAPVHASDPVPAFASSAMDGFAVRAQDLRGASGARPIPLRLVGESRAGHPCASSLGEGEAIAISTGAMMPAGADAVLRVEDARIAGGLVEAERELLAGTDLRGAGEDLAAGQLALEAGCLLGPAEIGVLASVGCAAPLCSRRPEVSLLSTGDELSDVGQPLGPGMIYETNSHVIGALLRRAGAALRPAERVGDDPRRTRDALARALKGADVAVICGGMSVGAHDHVRSSLLELGVQERFAGVALRPGKPTWFGVLGDTIVFGLPGNPLSATIACVLFVVPALLASLGSDPLRARATATLGQDWDKQPGRAHVLPCRLQLTDAGFLAHLPKAAGSHLITSMVGCDALAILPEDSGPAGAGERVEIELLRGWVGVGG